MDDNLLYDVIQYNKQRYIAFKNHEPFDYIHDFDKILNARYQKVSRIKKRFIYLACRYDYLFFCTFTFDNKYIKYCDRSKKDLIKHTLLKFDPNIKIILNKDFGKENDREHYHCIVATNECSSLLRFLLDNYPCRSNTEQIRLNQSSIKKVSKYINKLSNHCVKDSTKNSRIYFNFKGYGSFTYPEVRVAYKNDKDFLSYE